MKFRILPIGFLFFAMNFTGNAQQELPSVYQNIKINFIRTWDASAPESNATTLVTRPLRDVKQSTHYFDGLGRPLQSVVKKGSLVTATGVNVDMITTSLYDNIGREAIQYLPFSSTATDGSQNNGFIKMNPFQQQVLFYNAYLTGQAGETYVGQNNLNWAYSQTKFEKSPLNRPLETFAPGANWVGTTELSTEESRISLKAKYFTNTGIDGVRIWKVTNNSSQEIFGSYSSASGEVYGEGQLYKYITVNENNKQVIEFKDKEAKVILRKVQLTADADTGLGSGHDGWLCTYYIYDDLSNLRCVVQPKGVELIKFDWVLTNTTILNEQCFRYEYDYRKRMVMKKVPGTAEPDWMVYDKRDRVVMMKNHFLGAFDKWLVTLYDELNRPVQTGFLLDSYFQSTYQNASFAFILETAKNSDVFPFSATSTPSTTVWEYITKTGYDDYQSIPSASTLDNTFLDIWNAHYLSPYNSSPSYSVQPTSSQQVTGMVTWTETKVLNVSPNTYVYTVNIYDDNGRLIQLKTKNITGGKDVATTQYSWSGHPLIIINKQEKSGNPAQTTVVVSKMSYDDLGRVTKTEKKLSNTLVNSNAMSVYTVISSYEYDALGRLMTKAIGSKKDPSTGSYYATRQPLQELKYEYNVRGWILGMNRDYLTAEGQTSDGKCFGYELGYDKQENKAGRNFESTQLNGNISGMIWKSDGDDTRRKYDFTYDPVNRLLKGDFEQQNPDDHIWNNDKVNYSIQMGDGTNATTAYDANGNIKSMIQYGLKLGAPPGDAIDDLTYNYATNSNKLLSVVDAKNEPNTKLGDFRKSTLQQGSIDYYYDGSGNAIRDLNKDIGTSSANGLIYNHLNLLRVVNVYKEGSTQGSYVAKGSILYTYDAPGNRLKKQVTENGVPVVYNNQTYTSNISTITTYIGGLVYETKLHAYGAPLTALNYTDKLQYIGQEEGRIRVLYNNPANPNTPTGFEYDYMIKDHLGNVRTVLTEELKQDKYPVASLEPSKLATEKMYYDITDAQIVDKNTVTGLPAYANDNGIGNNPPDPAFEAANSSKLYKLNSSSNKTGLGVTLKVMSGDRIDIHGKSYYFENNTGGTSANSAVPVLDILNGLLGGPLGGVAAGAHGGVTGTQLNGYLATTNGINALLSNQTTDNNGTPTVPKAYINYIFFDEQFRSVGSGFSKVGSNSTIKDHFSDLQNLTVSKNGYIYIFVSNESPVNVFFDNMQVVHTRGAILEETHYYPFGLTQRGISSKAAAFGKPQNRFQYIGKEFQSAEFSDGSGLEQYDFGARMLDQQIGVWHNIDPLADKNRRWSPYTYVFNNPLKFVDPDGMEAVGVDGLTNEQWIESSRPGADRSLTKQFKQQNRLIASKGELGGEDSQSGLNADPHGINIGRLDQMTDEELFHEMTELFKFYSSGDLQKVAEYFIMRFRQNEGGVYENETLNDYINSSFEFINFRQNFYKNFEAALKAADGDASKIESVPLPDLPQFNSIFGGLGIIVHGTQMAKIYIEEISVNRTSGNYYAVFNIQLFDDFGVSRKDVLKFQNKSVSPPYTNGLQAWWILQHRRNYRPFVTRYSGTFMIEGNYKE